MTDYPRFEAIKGPPDTAHQHYNGGRLVDLVFRLIDRWRGGAGAAAVRAAPALDPASGPIEIHERRAPGILAADRSAAGDLVQAHARLTGLFPDESSSREFIIGSPRTPKLQASLLAALAVVLIAMVALEIISAQRMSGQPAPDLRQIPRTSSLRPQEAARGTPFSECRVPGADCAGSEQ